MTLIIGIRCSDGVVIGADSAMTYATSFGRAHTIKQKTEKLRLFPEPEARCIVGCSGAVGLAQRFYRIVGSQGFKQLRGAPEVFCKKVSKEAKDDFMETDAFRLTTQIPNRLSVNFGALMAFAIGNEFHLCEFEVGSIQPELKPSGFVTIGSGQQIADPFLGFLRRVLWPDREPTCSEAVLAVSWTLNHAITLSPGLVDKPLRIAELGRNRKGTVRAHILGDDRILEHNDNIESAEKALANALFGRAAEAPIPDMPVATSSRIEEG